MTPSVTNRTAVKPGFGKIPDRPSFDKKSLAAKKAGSSGAAVSTSTLKESASKGVATATKSEVFQTRSRASTSGPFVAGTHNMGVNDFYRNRTNTTPHGFYAAQGGKFQLESDMGMTRRSTNRLLDKAYGNQQMQMQYLNNMNAMYGCSHTQQTKMSPMQFFSELSTMVTGLITEFGGKSGKTQAAKTVISSNSIVASMQNAKTHSELSMGIDTAQNSINELDSRMRQQQSQIDNLNKKHSDLKYTESSAKKALSDNKDAIGKKNAEVINHQQREAASKNAMDSAQAQVDNLKSQLQNASPAQKSSIEASLRQAEEQLNLKKDQYKQAIQDKERAQTELKSLQDSTPELESSYNLAKANLKENESEIVDLQNEQLEAAKERDELDKGVAEANARLATLKPDN